MAPVVAKTAAPGAATSRVIVKNLPKHATEERLREYFSAVGEVTDCSLRKTKAGKSRQFAFIGFRNESGAKEAVQQLNRSFFDTARVAVEIAHAPGSEALARPWSRHAPGSSAHQKQHPELYKKGDKNVKPAAAIAKPPDVAQKGNARPGPGERKVQPPTAPGKARQVKMAEVKPNKAGVGAHRVHTEFASSDDEDMPADGAASDPAVASSVSKPAKKNDDVAFDDSLSDLAYLRAKSGGQQPAEAPTDTVIGNNNDDNDDSDDKDEDPEEDEDQEQDEEEEQEEEDRGKADNEEEGKAAKADADEDMDKKETHNADGADEQEAREELESSGRLYVTNLPYGATEDELRSHFEPLGEVASVYICKDEDTSKSRGFGYVTYVFPECAVRAISELDMGSFQGRLIRIAAAQARPPPPTDADTDKANSGAKSSYRRQREEKKKKVEAHLEHTWNLLYVSANAAADAAAAQLGVSKSELFGKDAANSAVTAALTETSVIQQTKQWLKREGIRIDAFEQSGSSLTKSKAILEADAKRRDDTFIVKHLPSGATKEELRDRFARFGELVKCALAPSGTVAVVQYTEKGQAQRAFQKLAFSRFRHVPLYLEWAPEGVFDDSHAAEATGSAAFPDKVGVEGEDGDADDDGASGGSLFVKNLNFSTTEATLKLAFRGCKGFRSAIIMKKKAAVAKGAQQKKDQESLSMGYGFLEFDTPQNAAEALRRKQGAAVDGHALQLQVSQRRGGASANGRQAAAAGTAEKGKGAKLTSSRICVRNLAFEANKKELSQLFGAYGSVTSVRIPKKSDYSGHRGFAFIDFASKSEAAAAYEALQHTHLYGRRLVIEPAEEKSTTVDSVQSAAQKRKAAKESQSEAKKRRRAGVLNTSSDANGGSFEDAML